MNVSSVKNLNGEVFSAVQDASLTNVVQTNSGNWQDITAYQSNSASYLTAHQDLSDYQTTAGMVNYYTTAEAETLSSMFSGAIDYVSANAGDEFPVSADEAIQYVQTNSGTIDETVTSYQTNSGDYIKESELEYNAVDEISGIAGSAISQYGAEKQWLVHDDTLVHISNSAQYALGVNISALQRLMGVDETVLYSATTSAGVLTANLSEPLSSFNTIEVYSNRKNAGSLNLVGYTKFKTDYMPEFISVMGNTKAGNNETYLTYELFGVSQTALTFISGTNLRVQNTSLTVLESPGFSNIGITKVVGIGRKQ